MRWATCSNKIQLMRPWKCLARRSYRWGTKVVPQSRHSCKVDLHSITCLLTPPPVKCKSNARLTLGACVVLWCPFFRRMIANPPHEGHFELVISTCRLTFSFRLSCAPCDLLRFFLRVLLVRTNTRFL